MSKQLPSQQYLQECFIYNELEGVLYWKERPNYHFKEARFAYSFNKKLAGKKAGVINNGYMTIGLNKTYFKAHLLIWKLLTDTEPKNSIYHLNQDISDNRIENLCDGDMRDIGKVKLKQANNTSGFTGVSFDKSKDSWNASITRNRISYNLGYFTTAEEASVAYIDARDNPDLLLNKIGSSKKKRYKDVLITKELVDLLLEYEDGVLYWKERFAEDGYYSSKSCACFNSQHNGKQAGSLDVTYLKVELFGKKYKVHRLIWLMFNEKEPEKLLDHIDGDKLNNRIENLREADYVTNGMNRKSHSNKSLPKGVTYVKNKNRFVARIMTNGKSIYLGWFNDVDSAKIAYDNASVMYHGSFSNLG